ncbi:MAG TPA: D-alanyl-D-alanine carboxypeptidase/D-alanyl-D-alanine-endopeptidase [Acidimicrobiia bacterium]|nr:D-alanyl-D-alanine carboxypeptidase/D-alanyl-D-alanine-endopeptidase [Acidimicrobiia bacterium]
MTPTRVFAVLLLVAALACGYLAVQSDAGTAAAGTRPAGELVTPLWSPRRVPEPFVDLVGAQKLQAELDQAVAGTDACFAVNAASGPVATHAADTPVIPASTQKLLTAAAALSVIGPDATFETRAVSPQDVQGGTIDRLYLVGGGDPLLSTADFRAELDQQAITANLPTSKLEDLADAVVAHGVHRITNGIVGDDSRYDETRYVATWSPSYRTGGSIGPVGALEVNRGFAVSKPIPVGAPDPSVLAASKLTDLLKARGVTVGGAPAHGTAPANAVEVAKLESPPLKDVVHEMLTSSDNLAAEMLVREIGVRVSHSGTTESGVKAVAAKLGELGLPTANMVLVDGSGLDRGNRVTCSLLAAAVDLGAQPQFRAIWDGLPVAGGSGTLAAVLKNSKVAGKLRAKTGFLNGVAGLAGLVDVSQPMRFAFVANGNLDESHAIALRALVGEIIGTFPDAPAADQLVPAPAAATAPGSTP